MDKKLEALKKQAVEKGASLAVMNALLEAKRYTGVLDAVVRAGSPQALADGVGVTYQAVQQWLKVGYVPFRRLPEVETVYGVPRVDLMNPKYVSALAEPTFTTDV
jgi:hypothetical protein